MIFNHKSDATIYISLIRGLDAYDIIEEAHALSSKKNTQKLQKIIKKNMAKTIEMEI